MTAQQEPPSGFGAARVRARALLLAEALDLGGLAPGTASRRDMVSFPTDLGHPGFAFRWGGIVLFGGDDAEAAAAVAKLRPRLIQPVATASDEQAWLEVAAEDGIDLHGTIQLRHLDPDRMALVADALAKSVALAHQEDALARSLDAMDPVIADLERRGRLALSTRPLLRVIGAALAARSRAMARIDADGRPDVLWEHGDLLALHQRLVDEFELAERSTALDRKLALVGETVQTMLGLVEARRSLGLELAVGTLIAIEVGAALYDAFLH